MTPRHQMFARSRENRQCHEARRGFTLVEILIVISIIAVLAGMVLVGVQAARENAQIALSKTTISDLTNALERYVQDEGEYPGMRLEPDAERNDFPLLFDALFGTPRPKGPGGRGAPYTNIPEEQIGVYDRDMQAYRTATRQERFDKDVPKFYLDGWGEPLVYRANKGKDLSQYEFMHNSTADIYSKGPDGIDQTMLGEDGDDVGNW